VIVPAIDLLFIETVIPQAANMNSQFGVTADAAGGDLLLLALTKQQISRAANANVSLLWGSARREG